MRALALVGLALVVCTVAGGAVRAQFVAELVTHGLSRTRSATIRELLPREPPASYTHAELADFERRLNNLALFDRAEVVWRDDLLHVSVREKWTLIPDVAFATGKTAADLYIAAGATEYNFLGLAAELSIAGYREQRGFGFNVGFSEHEYRHRRWSYGGLLSHGSAESRFDDGSSWFTTGTNLTLWTSSRPLLSPYLRYQMNLFYQAERISEVVGPERPPGGHAVQLGMSLTYDSYRWHDLVARGLKVSLVLGPGVFVPASQPRHFMELNAVGALALARYTMLTARWASALSSRGNANASYLVGSIEGVRGLDDARYRSWVQTTLNIELRQALPLLERLALQGVLFVDAAAFERMNARGGRAEGVLASSVGAGARVLPTFLAQLIFRLDVAYLLAPQRSWFMQMGVAQYF